MAAGTHLQACGGWQPLMPSPARRALVPVLTMCATQISGLNLLKYKAGPLGAPCYHRYLRGVYALIHKYGGGILYYGAVRLPRSMAQNGS